MVNKTRSTVPVGANQPVRFYKFVAVSFLCLTVLLLGLIVFMGAKRAEITVITRSDAVDVTFPLEIGAGATAAPVSGTVTTTVVTAQKSFQPRSTRQETVSRASGVVKLYNDSGTAQPLVATTRLLSPANILYRLKKGVTVPAKGTVEAEVYADKEGEDSNLDPAVFSIPGLSAARQKEVYAKSERPLKAGVRQIGIVGEADIERATAEMLEELKVLGQAKLETQFPGAKVFSLPVQHVVEPDTAIGEETDSFVLSGRLTLAGVALDAGRLAEYGSGLLGKQVVENSEILESAAEQAGATLDEYDPAQNLAKLKVVHTGFVNIDPNSRALQKAMFFGKTEDEVRRYLLSLDHVQGVEVKFKPMWNKTVPHVGDHVSVTVKQVK